MYAYDRKLATGAYINPSIKALQQARMYVHYETGGVGPAELTDVSNEERKEHGDIVIADALSMDFDKAPKIPTESKDIPENSYAGRKAKHFACLNKSKKPVSWRKVFDYA